MFEYNRSVSLVRALFGAVTNLALAIQVLAAWRSLRWEPESEWEASGDSWRVDGVKVIWGLLSAYFASAATVCSIGFLGIIKVPIFTTTTITANPSFRANPHLSDFTATIPSLIFLSVLFSPSSPPMRLSTPAPAPASAKSSHTTQSSCETCSK